MRRARACELEILFSACVSRPASAALPSGMPSTPHAAAEPAPPPAPVPVVAEKVRVSDVPTVLTGIGSVVAYNVVQVHAQVTGTIDKIGFTEGQTVHPGSLIAQLDPRPFQAALQQAEAALARDNANLVADQANLGRYATLLKQGFATAQQVTDQTATVEWAASGHRRRQGSDLQCPDPARLHHDHLADQRRDRYQAGRYRQYRAAVLHHADRYDHADPADLGHIHAAAGRCARGAAGDGRRASCA